jgi:hypothetical protein
MTDLPGHKAFIERLAAIQGLLVSVHRGGLGMSSASKGNEREQFVRTFLEGVLPNVFRISSGDVIDSDGHRSGQLDCILERPFAPGLPMPGGAAVRLALAEAVVGVVEVKSDLSTQWDEVLNTARRVSPLKRTAMGAQIVMGPTPQETIPTFAVGYTGWKTIEALQKNVERSGVWGGLVIDSGLYWSPIGYAEGPVSLWMMICDLYAQTTGLVSAITNPLLYATKAMDRS